MARREETVACFRNGIASGTETTRLTVDELKWLLLPALRHAAHVIALAVDRA